MPDLSEYLDLSAPMDEDALEGWIFLDFQDDGRVLALPRNQFEAIYRPGPEDQGG